MACAWRLITFDVRSKAPGAVRLDIEHARKVVGLNIESRISTDRILMSTRVAALRFGPRSQVNVANKEFM